MSKKSPYPADVSWHDWREGLLNGAYLTGRALDSLVALEQTMIRSLKETRCCDCGDPGEVIHNGVLVKSVDHYFLCNECDAHFEGNVGCARYTVLIPDGQHYRIAESLTNARKAERLARTLGGRVRDNVEALRLKPCDDPDCYACSFDAPELCYRQEVAAMRER